MKARTNKSRGEELHEGGGKRKMYREHKRGKTVTAETEENTTPFTR